MYKNVEIKTWLIGTGNMGKEYVKVLSALQEDYIAVGRGEESAEMCIRDSQMSGYEY